MTPERAAILRRTSPRGTTVDVLTMVVPCEFSDSGEHFVRVALWDNGQIAVMRCECEGEHVGAARAMHRLGADGTCGHALGYMRRWMLGEEGEPDSYIHQHVSTAARSFMRAAREHSVERRCANRHYPRLHVVDRPAPDLLSRLFREGMGFTDDVISRTVDDRAPTFEIVTDRDSRPVRALIDGDVVAKRARGVAGWMLVADGLRTAQHSVCSENRYGCPVCVTHGRSRSDGVRFGFQRTRNGDSTARRKHASSEGHRRAFERAVIETLANLPGVGR